MAQSAKNTIFGRYFIADYDNPPYYTNNILTTTRAGLEDRTQTVTLGNQYSINPTFVNAFHATFNRLAINRAAVAYPGLAAIAERCEALPEFRAAKAEWFPPGE